MVPPAKNKINGFPVTPGVSHTRPPPGAPKAKGQTNVHACVQKEQKDEDMRRRQDKTSVRVVAMKGNQVHNEPDLLIKTWAT